MFLFDSLTIRFKSRSFRQLVRQRVASYPLITVLFTVISPLHAYYKIVHVVKLGLRAHPYTFVQVPYSKHGQTLRIVGRFRMTPE